MRGALQRPMVTTNTFSRRHIDLQRVAAALCPACEDVAARRATA